MYLDVAKFFNIHPMGETATHPSVRSTEVSRMIGILPDGALIGCACAQASIDATTDIASIIVVSPFNTRSSAR